ncbi:MAG: copper transporter [Coriobacteriia bacterium]|nr:copper transporter [Coriobacteriia bacterium]
MYNLRYHIASLVAVFLALSVGLLLGTVVVERGALTNQGTQIVRDLQNEFADLRKDNADLRAGLERDRLFAADAVPTIVSGALEGQAVLVLTNVGRADGLAATVEAIERAGGKAVVLTSESPSFGIDELDPDALTAALAESAGGETTATPDVQSDTVSAVAEALAREWTTPTDSRPVTQLLLSAGQIGLEGAEDTVTVGGMAFLGSWNEKADPAALALAARLAARGLPVVGVESASRVSGVVEAAMVAGFSAVDDVTSPQGTVSLVWILSGRTTGYFGVREGAENIYPVLSGTVD